MQGWSAPGMHGQPGILRPGQLSEVKQDYYQASHSNVLYFKQCSNACAGSSPADQATFLKSNEYYFYQASDGQWLFLTALDMRILLAHYGSYAALPGRLAAQVVNIDNITQTQAVRKRVKFLGHLPLTGVGATSLTRSRAFFSGITYCGQFSVPILLSHLYEM